MPTKAEQYAQMADQVARQLTGSWQEWAGFLTTADVYKRQVLGGIGALVYFKFIKQKPKTKGSDNLDDYDYGEDDTEQEDEDPWETEESDEPEDAGGGGDEESENPAQ